MKSHLVAFQASALFLSLLSSVTASGHGNLHHRHHHSNVHQTIEKRGPTCSFPSDAGLVAVTPNKQNGGWAMSPNQPCTAGNYCPYACPPGKVMAQWDPKATSYVYPQSMNGGLFCDENGEVSKPFPNKPYCVDGTGALGAKNEAGDVVSFCQTVLPGNEAMLIPTRVTNNANLAVPDPSYWCSTAAHFYINPPGVDTDDACVWGTSENPWGNWSPYVAGANADENGDTFIKLGWNPIYLEPETPFKNKSPSFGVRIECDGGNCNGLPCEIDPTKNSVNELTGSGSSGAGGSDFCVVTVPKGSSANVVVFGSGGGGGGGGGDSPPAPSPPEESSSPSPPPPPPSSSSEEPPPPPPSTTSESSLSSPSSTSDTSSTSSPSFSPSSSFSTSTAATTSAPHSVSPHVMVEMPSSSIAVSSNSSTINTPTVTTPTETAPPDTGAASITSLSVMSLVFSLVLVSIVLNF